MSKLFACSRRLWPWVNSSKKLPNLTFIVISKSKEKMFLFWFVWGSQSFQSSNKKCNNVMGIRAAKETCSPTMFEETDADLGNTFPYLRSCVCTFECPFLDMNRFKVKFCWFFEDFQLTYVLDTKRVQLVKKRFLDLMYVLGKDFYKLFFACK